MGDAEERARRNRANSLKSTGPRTEAGKNASSRRNALRHGLASERVLALTRAEVETVQEFVEDVHRCLGPVGPVEALLVDRATSILWRLRRISRLETELLRVEGYGSNLPSLQLGVAFSQAAGNSDSFTKLARYEANLDRAFHRVMHELERVQAQRAGQPMVPPITVDVNVEAP